MSVQCKAKISNDIRNLLSNFQSDVGLFREGYNYLDNPELSIRIARKYMDDYPDFYFLDGWGTPLGINNECGKLISKQVNNSHGGKRLGSGRKKGLPTENVRLVSDLVCDFKRVSDYYKTCSEEKRIEIRHVLDSLLKELKV